MDRAVVKYNQATGQGITKLRDLQEQALSAIQKYQDTLVILPTSYGKSLIYELVPFLVPNSMCIVTVPLNAIIEQQCSKLGGCCKNVNEVNSAASVKETAFLIGHPENFLEKTSLLGSLSSVKNHFFIIVDEAHCILEWGPDFRPLYSDIYKIRTLLGGGSRCTTVALTATASDRGQADIIKNLKMKNVLKVLKTPIRDNIHLSVSVGQAADGDESSVERVYEFILTDLFNCLKDTQDDYPVTLVYINSFHWCGFASQLGLQVLGDSFFRGDKVPGNERVQQYHAHLHTDVQKHVTSLLSRKASPLRLLLTTAALGMGADIKHIDQVVHLSPPSTIEGYVQQFGRCGRGGQAAKAILYFTKSDLSRAHTDNNMKDYCKNTTQCRREFLAQTFGTTSQSLSDNCCDICISK